MTYLFAVLFAVSLIFNGWQLWCSWRLAKRVVTNKRLLFRAVCAIEYYNKNIADGTPYKPRLDWLHGDFEGSLKQ